MRQFVTVEFRPQGRRIYTYAWDGPDEFAPGDEVRVPDSRSDGWVRAIVVSVSHEAPPFPCKPILGRVEDELADEPAEAAPALF